MKAFEDGLRNSPNFNARRLQRILDGWYLWELTLPTGSKILFVINEEGVHISYHLVSGGDGDKTRAFQRDFRKALLFSSVNMKDLGLSVVDVNSRDFNLESVVAAIREDVNQRSSEEDLKMSANKKVQHNFTQQTSTRLSITLVCAYRLPNLR